jgi:hypothetical protein
MAEDEISLRPIVLKPLGLQGSGFNPFSSFAKGSGQILKGKQVLDFSAPHSTACNLFA